jgi:DeoR/GlpR family transcriptional regulator of sugar metabolism
MLAHERAGMIVQRLRERGTVSAAELVRLLRVSAPTIRRDLEKLEGEGLLRRVHGGACLPAAGWPAGGAYLPAGTDSGGGGGGGPNGNQNGDNPSEAPFARMVDEHAAEKDGVAAKAASLVQPGQVVLLDIGTTTMRIARHLRGRNITVITASIAVLDALRDDEQTGLVLLGGSLRRNYQSLVGPLTEDALGSVSADIAFLTCTGIRQDGSVVDDITAEATVKRAIVRSANRVVLAAPASKFPGSGSLRICRLDDLDDLVTTPAADPVTLEHCRQGGTNVILAAGGDGSVSVGVAGGEGAA